MSLKQKTFSAVRWTAAAAVARALLQVIQVAVLARLLTPEDYGLMAIITVVLGFAALFADMGLNSAYLQSRDVTPRQRSSLFWANIVMSAILATLVAVTSPLVALFFGDDRLEPVLVLSASTFIVAAIGQQLRVTAQKDFDFRPLISLEIASSLIGFLIAIVAALCGFGVYALVLGAIAVSLAGTILAWLFLSGGWRPYWQFRFRDVKPFLRFGGAVVGDSIVNQFNRTIDLFLGGRMLIASQLGIYSVPRNLVLQLQYMVNPVITRVGFPLIAEVQHDIPRVRSIYLKMLNMTSSTNAPLYISIAFFAPEIVQLILGPKWVDTGDLLRILAIWGLLRSTGNPVGSLLLGMGRAGLSLRWNIAILFVVPPMLWFGSYYGTSGLAWALLAFQLLTFIPGWYVLVRPLCKASLIEYVSASLKPMLIAALAITPAYGLSTLVDGVVIKLLAAILVSAPLYLSMSYWANREWFNAMLELAERKV